jgi:hypothetical protein
MMMNCQATDTVVPPLDRMKEKLGLWLARLALRITRNRGLADCCSVLPLIPSRRFAICVQPGDQSLSRILSGGSWAVWRRPGEPSQYPGPCE